MGYYLPDALGSLRQLMDGGGQMTLSQSFDPFGSLLSRSGAAFSPYGFAGEWTDATGLQYLRARYYAPLQGRFMSRDPFPGLPGMPATLHPYVYALNNPVLYTDPSGEAAVAIILLIAAGGFITGATINTVQQYQANGGWCNYDWIEMLEWGVGGAAAASVLAVLGAASIGLIGVGLQGAAITLAGLGIAAPVISSLWGWGTAITGLGGAATTWLWTGQGLKEGVRGIAYQALQGLTNKSNVRLSNNLTLAQTVLSPLEYRAAQNNAGVARMAYGNAVERIVRDQVKSSLILRHFIKHVGGPGHPDFVGRGILTGLQFDITTPFSIPYHFNRPYGQGLIFLPYNRPMDFTLFP